MPVIKEEHMVYIWIDSEAIVVKPMVSHERWKEYNFSIESIA
jgi:hypothetical protein